ncbi:hypothetical protein FA10DRAFT_281823 [Acaromyces ingoldii]|uniref:Uncharacterized protein n=1 Tax=Acaromyces ingoldii TaxID=215250 RepID=A0A316YB36_9BASI|nr:hypothetical protein FA10DRAFT_281823 [Acaromyces ingoldii]PWN87020.1 hypothetical protein FA10DRAFT_281823 [Acaromyces ingoldii]
MPRPTRTRTPSKAGLESKRFTEQVEALILSEGEDGMSVDTCDDGHSSDNGAEHDVDVSSDDDDDDNIDEDQRVTAKAATPSKGKAGSKAAVQPRSSKPTSPAKTVKAKDASRCSSTASTSAAAAFRASLFSTPKKRPIPEFDSDGEIASLPPTPSPSPKKQRHKGALRAASPGEPGVGVGAFILLDAPTSTDPDGRNGRCEASLSVLSPVQHGLTDDEDNIFHSTPTASRKAEERTSDGEARDNNGDPAPPTSPSPVARAGDPIKKTKSAAGSPRKRRPASPKKSSAKESTAAEDRTGTSTTASEDEAVDVKEASVSKSASATPTKAIKRKPQPPKAWSEEEYALYLSSGIDFKINYAAAQAALEALWIRWESEGRTDFQRKDAKAIRNKAAPIKQDFLDMPKRLLGKARGASTG